MIGPKQQVEQDTNLSKSKMWHRDPLVDYFHKGPSISGLYQPYLQTRILNYVFTLVIFIIMPAQSLALVESIVIGESLNCSNRQVINTVLPALPNHTQLLLSPEFLNENAILEIQENGQDVAISGTPEGYIIQIPPRYGAAVFRLAQPFELFINSQYMRASNSKIRLILHCDLVKAKRLWQWYDATNNLTAYFSGGVGSLSELFPDTELNNIENSVYDSYTHALAIHLRAQAMLLAGRATDASEMFGQAADAWHSAGVATHASAAMVGLVEDLNRSGQYNRVLELTRDHEDQPDGTHYYGVRLENARCLSLHYLGELEQASQCYAWTSERFDELDEVLELASTSINFAAIERSLGKVESARRLLLDSVELAQGAQSFNAQGRAQFGLSGLARDEGDIAEALSRLQLAQQQFAAGNERRWQAAILMRMASLLIELQASGDARSAANQALSMLDAEHAPARVAAAQVLLARVELADGFPERGLDHADAALATYVELSMPEEISIARQLRSTLLLRAGYLDAASEALKQIPNDALFSPSQKALNNQLNVELALRSGNIEHAAKMLQGDALASNLRERLEYDRLTAEINWRSGFHHKAFAELRTRAGELSELTRSTGNNLLKYLLNESIGNLRRTAIDLIGYAIETGKQDKSQLLANLQPWLLSTSISNKTSQQVDHQDSDTALTRLLLTGFMSEPADDDAHAVHLELLNRLTRDTELPNDTSAVSKTGLNVIDALTKNGDPLLILMRGSHHSLRLWIEPGKSPIITTIDHDSFEQHLEPLRSKLSQPNSNLAEIINHSQFLSEQLFAGLDERPIPNKIQILSNDFSTGIPWSLLTWPGDEQPLAERATISLVIPVGEEAQSKESPGLIDVMLASQEGSILPDLSNAAVEPVLIQQNSPGHDVRTSALNNRQSILAALSEKGWLHLSAHGQTRSNRLIASGIWLEPQEEGDNPQFLSWLDVMQQGVNRDLVILNACQLAESRNTAANAALNFATAISRAGARNTIAAQWPVSDTASAIWVPAFYQSLTNTPSSDPSLALAEARRAMRASRAFRHPFHWAGWVHISRVNVNSIE